VIHVADSEPKLKKRKRQPYSREQVSTLEAEYNTKTYISKARRKELAQVLDLTERQIKVWYQNRRIKQKKMTTKKVKEDIFNNIL
jgi:hypothetical protein